MKKTSINFSDYANETLKALPGGILLTSKADDEVDSMVIGWGTLGITWSKPIFIAYVREGRHTRSLLDKNPEFTVNIPVGDFDKKIIGICGGKSGRDTDKIKEAGLTLVEPNKISVPGIKEFPLTLECRVVYQQTQSLADLEDDIVTAFYPQDKPSTEVRANKDPHICYYGEIVDAYIIED